VTVKKNKVAPPFKVAEFDIMYNEGISTEGDLIDLGVEHDIITKRGSFFSYGDIRLGQGRENAKTFLMENPDLAAEIDHKIREGFGLPINLAPATEVGTGAAQNDEQDDDKGSKSNAAASKASVRPAVDDEDMSYGADDDEKATLFDEAA